MRRSFTSTNHLIGTYNRMAKAPHRISPLLLSSYVFDWIIVFAVLLVAYALSNVTPYHRPFDLTDPSISFPYTEHERVPLSLLIIIAGGVPAIIIPVVCLLFIPPTPLRCFRHRHQKYSLRRKFWEWHVGWLGLALACASAFLITQSSKVLFGKPRPDLLSRCNPALDHTADHAVGYQGNGTRLVSWTICQQKDDAILSDGFQSFPSGHSSFSWAGLLYLSLFLAAKTGTTIPYLTSPLFVATPNPNPSLRTHAAAPPIWTLLLPFIPLAAAVYICSTRFTDYRHHGFDILSGSLLGILLGWMSFRWYHLPVNMGEGWAWGPRSRRRAFGRGIGGGAGYVVGEKHQSQDLEQGHDENYQGRESSDESTVRGAENRGLETAPVEAAGEWHELNPYERRDA